MEFETLHSVDNTACHFTCHAVEIEYIFQYFLEEGVATVFGASFGRHFGDNIRLSFSCTSIEDIKVGIARMKRALAKAKQGQR